jgi:hypothetical protein
MGFSVGVNPPKTPCTKGSHGIAQATIPNICKMPGPPAPFVPAPLPNIGKSELSPQGYSTTVTIVGEAVAIRGATFESIGDIASKGTGGGLISANCQGPTKFIAPGSMTVKIEGKNVHQLSDPMLNNCGPGGSPPNTGATMMGLSQQDSVIADCVAALAEARQLADQVRNLPKSVRPSTVSVVRTAGGPSAAGVTGGAVNSTVAQTASNGPPDEHACGCAEKNAISNAMGQGMNVQGSGGTTVIATVNVRGDNEEGAAHNTKKPACRNCRIMLIDMDITEC